MALSSLPIYVKIINVLFALASLKMLPCRYVSFHPQFSDPRFFSLREQLKSPFGAQQSLSFFFLPAQHPNEKRPTSRNFLEENSL